MRAPIFTRNFETGEITVDALSPVLEIANELLYGPNDHWNEDCGYGIIILSPDRLRIKVANADCLYRFVRRGDDLRTTIWEAEGG